jgi:hypothetical protein
MFFWYSLCGAAAPQNVLPGQRFMNLEDPVRPAEFMECVSLSAVRWGMCLVPVECLRNLSHLAEVVVTSHNQSKRRQAPVSFPVIGCSYAHLSWGDLVYEVVCIEIHFHGLFLLYPQGAPR